MRKVILKKREDRRVRSGHLWIYSNEIDTNIHALSEFTPGECVNIANAQGEILGSGYINPHALLAIRLYAYEPNVIFDENLIRPRLQTALSARIAYFSAPFYRICFAEGDFLPGIIIDRFDDLIVLQLTTQGAWRIKEQIIALIIELLQPQGILLKNEQPHLTTEGLEPSTTVVYGHVPEEVLLYENNIPFYAPLHSGQKTGWFYDQRNNRSRLQHFVKGKNVLDVFSYLGSFGIYAGVYGAASVTFIESSKLASAYISRNLEVNNLLASAQIITEDAFVALKNLKNQRQQFDVIIVDPPAFIKRKKDHEEGFLAYQRINELALSCLKEQGVLVSSSCSMHLSEVDLKTALIKANKNRSQLSIFDVGYQAPDHPWHLLIPETLYLKALFIYKN
jgi:23S rRNA (cytosine1962-C5)-methyltransferase